VSMNYSGRRPLSIAQSLVLSGSAASWYLTQTSIALAKRGHRVVVVSPPGGTAESAAAAGLEVESSIDLRTHNPLRLAGAVKSLRKSPAFAAGALPRPPPAESNSFHKNTIQSLDSRHSGRSEFPACTYPGRIRVF
jgi:hypothetical protein